VFAVLHALTFGRQIKRGRDASLSIGYMGRSDVTENLLSRYDRHFVGITWRNVGKDLSCCLNNIQSAGLRKCPYDRYSLPTKRISAIAKSVKNIYQSFTLKMAAKTSWHRNFVTVGLCIAVR